MKTFSLKKADNPKISTREIEVLNLVSLGYTAKEMAQQLFLSHWTIQDHKRNLIEKLDCNNAPAAVRKGFELGLLPVKESNQSKEFRLFANVAPIAARAFQCLLLVFLSLQSVHTYAQVNFEVEGTAKLNFTSESITTVLDFETSGSSTDFRYFGGTFDSQNASIIDNPAMTGINTSAKVLAFVKAANAPTWAGAFTSPIPSVPFQLPSNNGLVCLKVWKSTSGNVTIKLENPTNGGPTSWLKTVNNTQTNQWVEFCFDVSQNGDEDPFMSGEGFTYTQLSIFFDYGMSGTDTDVTHYMDDVLVKSVGGGIHIDDQGKIGIGRTAMTNMLEVSGDASKSSPGDWMANSDARLKKNILNLIPNESLDQLLSLQGITYEWNDTHTGITRPTQLQYGFTAQNILKVFPTLVKEDRLGFLQTSYGTLDAMYVEAIRALNNRITALEQELNQQENIELRVLRIEDAIYSL